jgi:hypothetical protein
MRDEGIHEREHEQKIGRCKAAGCGKREEGREEKDRRKGTVLLINPQSDLSESRLSRNYRSHPFINVL